MALLLTCGRVTRELRGLLERARYDADPTTGSPARYPRRLPRPARPPDRVGSRPAELAVLLVDLDGFGQLNKTVGHAAGDAALVSLVAAGAG